MSSLTKFRKELKRASKIELFNYEYNIEEIFYHKKIGVYLPNHINDLDILGTGVKSLILLNLEKLLVIISHTYDPKWANMPLTEYSIGLFYYMMHNEDNFFVMCLAKTEEELFNNYIEIVSN